MTIYYLCRTCLSILLRASGHDCVAARHRGGVGAPREHRVGLCRFLEKARGGFLFCRWCCFGGQRWTRSIGIGSSRSFGKEAENALLLAGRGCLSEFLSCGRRPRRRASRCRFFAHDAWGPRVKMLSNFWQNFSHNGLRDIENN